MTTGGPPRGMMNADAVDDSRLPAGATETCLGTGTGPSKRYWRNNPDYPRQVGWVKEAASLVGHRSLLPPCFQASGLQISLIEACAGLAFLSGLRGDAHQAHAVHLVSGELLPADGLPYHARFWLVAPPTDEDQPVPPTCEEADRRS